MGAVDEWVMHDDHYYVNQQACSLKPKSLNELKDWPVSEFRPCKKCHEEREELLERQSLLLQRHGRLRGLELFSGKTLYVGFVVILNLHSRCWWSWDRFRFVRFRGDSMGDRIFTQCSTNLQVRLSRRPVSLGLTNVLCRRNHPDTIVYNQCTNLCLQHAIDTQENKRPKPLLSLDDKKSLPPMPKPGEVDFVYGGT